MLQGVGHASCLSQWCELYEMYRNGKKVKSQITTNGNKGRQRTAGNTDQVTSCDSDGGHDLTKF